MGFVLHRSGSAGTPVGPGRAGVRSILELSPPIRSFPSGGVGAAGPPPGVTGCGRGRLGREVARPAVRPASSPAPLGITTNASHRPRLRPNASGLGRSGRPSPPGRIVREFLASISLVRLDPPR